MFTTNEPAEGTAPGRCQNNRKRRVHFNEVVDVFELEASTAFRGIDDETDEQCLLPLMSPLKGIITNSGLHKWSSKDCVNIVELQECHRGDEKDSRLWRSRQRRTRRGFSDFIGSQDFTAPLATMDEIESFYDDSPDSPIVAARSTSEEEEEESDNVFFGGPNDSPVDDEDYVILKEPVRTTPRDGEPAAARAKPDDTDSDDSVVIDEADATEDCKSEDGASSDDYVCIEQIYEKNDFDRTRESRSNFYDKTTRGVVVVVEAGTEDLTARDSSDTWEFLTHVNYLDLDCTLTALNNENTVITPDNVDDGNVSDVREDGIVIVPDDNVKGGNVVEPDNDEDGNVIVPPDVKGGNIIVPDVRSLGNKTEIIDGHSSDCDIRLSEGVIRDSSFVEKFGVDGGISDEDDADDEIDILRTSDYVDDTSWSVEKMGQSVEDDFLQDDLDEILISDDDLKDIITDRSVEGEGCVSEISSKIQEHPKEEEEREEVDEAGIQHFLESSPDGSRSYEIDSNTVNYSVAAEECERKMKGEKEEEEEEVVVEEPGDAGGKTRMLINHAHGESGPDKDVIEYAFTPSLDNSLTNSDVHHIHHHVKPRCFQEILIPNLVWLFQSDLRPLNLDSSLSHTEKVTCCSHKRVGSSSSFRNPRQYQQQQQRRRLPVPVRVPPQPGK